MKLLWFVLTTFILIEFSFCRPSYFPFAFMRNNKCTLTLGTSKLPTHSLNSLIYSDGKLDSSYQPSSPIHHQSPPSNDVDFIYANNTLNHQFVHNSLIVNIHSQNNTICDPKININRLESNNDINKNIHSNEIEIIYNCNPKSFGFTLITISIKAPFCDEIDLTWEKHCNGDQLTHMPRINLGFTKGKHDIINHGVMLSHYRNMIDKNFASKTSNHFLINDNMLHLYISSGDYNKTHNVSTMTLSNPSSHINVNHNYYSEHISSIIAGDISKGGVLELNEDKEFYLFFECKDKQAREDYKADLQLDIPFTDNNKIVSLYFTKVCKIYKPALIVRLFRLVYWTAILSLIGFIVVLIYFHFTQGEVKGEGIKEIYNKTKENINSFIKESLPNMNGYISTSNNENENNISMENGDDDEEETLNIKITSDNIISENNSDTYGGI